MSSRCCLVEVSIERKDGRIYFLFLKDKSDRDRIEELRFSMGQDRVFVDLGNYKTEEVHPDLICLTAILLCNPFVGEELKIKFPMSEYFLKSVQSVITRYRLVASGPHIDEIKDRPEGVPGLAFSGGADSSAALALLPGDCVPIFLWRPENENSVYNSDAALRICSELEDTGYQVEKVITDLESIRDPIGFPTDLANAIPSILLSEILHLDSVSFGTVLESGFGIGHEKYVDYGKGAHWRFFSTLFGAVKLKLSMPTIGVSEVGTAIINSKSTFGSLSQSCIRGTWNKPCLKCWKCFRKELLNYSLGLNESPDFVGLMANNEVQVRLSNFPISHENVIAYSLQRIDLDIHPYLKPLADKLDMKSELGMLESWYSPSLDFVPRKHRHTIRDKVLSFMPPMSPYEESLIHKWDMLPHLEATNTKMRQEKLTSFWQDFMIRFG